MIDVILSLLQPDVLIPWLLGMAFGVFVGSTPGLTATMAVALIVPFTFYLPNPNTGLALILGVSNTAIFAGDIPAVNLRIPGTPASAASTIDGHELAKQGRAMYALQINLWSSVIGGVFGTICLILIAPQLARFAILFSNYEYFWLAILGLGIGALVIQGPPLRGVIAALLGMMLGTVGIDRISGVPRFTFGQPELTSGFDFIAIMIGLFGISEVLRNLRSGLNFTITTGVQKAKDTMADVWRALFKHKFSMLKGSIVGTFIGVLPGAGADIAAWASYGLAQRTSKHPEEFGKGSTEGVVAPGAANNAAISAAWIPSLVFGIPGDSVTAIALGALMMYNIKPGPLIFEQNGAQIQAIFAIALITQFLMIPAGYFGIRAFSVILKLPRTMIMTAVMIFAVVGSYSLRNDLFDVWVMAAAGVAGFFLEAWRIPLAPLILGLILGPMVEENLRAGLIKSSGNFLPFLTRPICIALWLLLLTAILAPTIARRIRPPKTSPGGTA